MNKKEVTSGDFFAGGGGVTRALYNMENVKVKWVLNHDITAIETNIFHHKDVKHYWSDIYVQDEHEIDPVDFIWASIECTQHSKAKGGKDKELGSYMMGWELVRYIDFLRPKVLGIENVPEFKKWGPVGEDGKPIKSRQGEHFEEWKAAIMALGYEYMESIRNAADDGLPTRRVRYFAYFYKPGIDIEFPEFTHSKTGEDGKKKWEACRPHIDTNDEGVSIFGRQFNESLPRHLRKPHVPNTLKRIAGGIKKYYKEYSQVLCQHYGTLQFQNLEAPINTVTCRDTHWLISFEKMKFVMDHCRTDNFNLLDEPINPQLTRQSKQIVSVEHEGFISHQYNSNGNPGANNQSLNEPMNSITTGEKIQFISMYFNSGGKPESQNQSLDAPINAILTSPTHKSLVTVLENFDIKARFLRKEELASCSTFPRDYFSKPGLKLSHKKAIKLIGNAVPPEWARKLIAPAIKAIEKYKEQ